ncbi:hypothetical protein K7X08_002037 [Anisodus acutangulus]|uniref:Uncharacterized protein n=1 Tax=Anisodus acutangulus TaxID=402998 RepID=A0A9Q1R6Y4_9SOLA|nr:hypothetical protein K7X08_002037 [Anisodus acutangulus]
MHSYITTPELTKLIQWKLTRGKWRPRLLDFVSSLDAAVVRSASEKAFQSLPDISKAITVLTVLKGNWLLQSVTQKTTLKQYLVLVDKLQAKSKELSATGDTFTPSDVERALWSSAVVTWMVLVEFNRCLSIRDVLSGTSSDRVHFSDVMEEWFGQHWWNSLSNLLLLTTLLVSALLISFKRVDSLRYTAALSVSLAVVFVVITAGIVIVKIINGSIGMPLLLPKLVDQASFWKLFTTVPVLVTAYICHHNSMKWVWILSPDPSTEHTDAKK